MKGYKSGIEIRVDVKGRWENWVRLEKKGRIDKGKIRQEKVGKRERKVDK